MVRVRLIPKYRDIHSTNSTSCEHDKMASEAPDLCASTLSQAEQPVAVRKQVPQMAQAQRYARSQESVYDKDPFYKLQFLPARERD